MTQPSLKALEHSPLIAQPQWPAPSNVKSVITLAYPVDHADNSSPYGLFNLATHVGDSPEKVLANREQLSTVLSVQRWQWLNQVHGINVISAENERNVENKMPEADGCYTQQTKIACAVLTADCLPILLCDKKGHEVAAVHAGWRGLAAGVVANAIAKFRGNNQLMAFLGPAIGPFAFEVGAEVKQAFIQAIPNAEQAFKASYREKHYFADLYQLARLQLKQLGVEQVFGGDCCTLSDQRFYSYRGQQVTGRMVSAIWLE